MMDAMDAYGVRGSVSLNTALCIHHPEIIEAYRHRRIVEDDLDAKGGVALTAGSD